MNKWIPFVLSLIIFSNLSWSQTYPVDTLLYNGDINKHINLVIMGDGYQEEELAQFLVDANNFTIAFFQEPPYSQYQNYFNVFTISVPSNESGADHPGTATDVSEPAHEVKSVDNVFGSTFDAFGIHRLLVAQNSGAVYTVLANNFPSYDQVLMLVNSPFYGGAGGAIPTASLNSSSIEIAIHELGHSFVNLRDEYYAGDQFSQESINMTQETDPALVKWKNWMGEDGIGIFQHCCGGESAQWYRPHQNCKMRFLGPPFCSVCIEGTIERIHTLTNPILSFSPEETSISAEAFPIDLDLELILPIPNTLKSDWLINFQPFATNTNSVQIDQIDLEPGMNTVSVAIQDTTELLRIDNHSSIHLYTVTWNIDNIVSSTIELNAIQNQINWSIYPNPTSDWVAVEVENERQLPFQIVVYNATGEQLLRSPLAESQAILQVQDFPTGTYILELWLDNIPVSRQQLQKQ